MAASFDYEIEEHIAVLRNSGDYSLELNRVAFNGSPAKLDLRKWKSGLPMKGVSFTDEEARVLLEALKGLNLGDA